MKIQKNQEYIVDIIDNGFEGEGIAKIDNFTIFVPQTLKGEKVKILIVKVQSSFAYAKVIEIISKSKNRMDSDCSTYKRCGGCNLRFMDYNQTLELKQSLVENCLKKALHKNIRVNPLIGMGNPFYYRNKLQFPVSIDKKNIPIMGVYASRTHEIIPTDKCMIQNEKIQHIAKDTFKYLVEHGVKAYDEKTQKGELRHIVIRIGIYTNEVMIILVLNNENFKNQDGFIEYITEKHSEIKTIVKNINDKNTNVILGNKNSVVYGTGYIHDYLGDYEFKISPMSFYQINPIQTEMLYNTAIDFADLKGNEIVYDLYCGIGTIGIFASKNAKKVYGIEVIENAIKDARENAKINRINNIEFYCGDVEKTLPKIMNKDNSNPDVVFIDPPRKGCDKKTINYLLELHPKKIIYISCNPATFARDTALLNEQYILNQVQPVDMFPWTKHVETVSLLTLKNTHL